MHGFNHTYQKGCRCEECKRAHREYMRAWRKCRAELKVDATEARQIIELLLTTGETCTSIAKKAHLSYMTISNILFRQFPNIRIDTFRKIKKLDRWGVTND